MFPFCLQACTEMVMPMCSDGIHDMFQPDSVSNTAASINGQLQ